MYRLLTCLVTAIVALAAEAQIDYKLYFANNVGDLARLSKIKANDSGLKWTEITDGTVSGNRTDVEAVKKMFREERQKGVADQELFWKMRDDNLLCFRINDGQGTYGEFEVSAVQGSGRGTLTRNVSSYFFVNTDNHEDSLFITVNRKGCSASPSDTLHFKYYIYEWDDNDLLLFKLDSRRRNTGLKYKLELVAQNMEGTNQKTTTLDLQGNSFQSYYRPDGYDLTAAYLVSNENRLELDKSRLIWGVNLSDKLNRLWLNDNFNLDKHKNRELTIFNMLGSGLFEQYDTLFLTIMDKNGPIKAKANASTKLAEGFTFNIAETDAEGKYVVGSMPMKYAGYDAKNGIHKILTWGNPCYIEVFATGHYPALYKYEGAVDPKTKVLNKKRTSGTLRLIEGTTTTTGPDLSSNFLYVLQDEQREQEYEGKLHKVFSKMAYDLNTQPSSSVCNFIEDGGYQTQPKLLEGKPVEKYAEMAISYSVAKTTTTADNTVTLQFQEQGSSTPITISSISTEKFDGNDFPTLTRSWYTVRWNIVGALPKKDVAYKPRLTIGKKVYNSMPQLQRTEIDEKKEKEEAQKKAEDYAFNNALDFEFNSDSWYSVLGNLAKLDLRRPNYPGINISVVPFFAPLKGVFELDVNISLARRQDESSDGSATLGKKFRDNLSAKAMSSRFKLQDPVKNDKDFGMDAMSSAKSSKIDKEHWFQAELDDIFKMERNKLGYGPFVDIHFGFGIKLWGAKGAEEDSRFYLKAIEGHAGYGLFATYNWHFLDDFMQKYKLTKYFKFKAYANAVAQVQAGFSFKHYNFKTNGILTERALGFSVDGMGQIKAGIGAELRTNFAGGDDQGGGQGGGDNQGGDDNQGGGDDQGGDDDDLLEARAVQMPLRAAQSNTPGAWANRFLYFSLGARGGFKVQLNGAFVKFLDGNPQGHDFDYGGSVLAVAGAELYVDAKIGPLVRINPRWSGRIGFFYPFPDDNSNPTIPLYPNYHPVASAPRFSSWRAPAAPTFPIGRCIMEGMDMKAQPFFTTNDYLLMAYSHTTAGHIESQVKEYAKPMADQKTEPTSGEVVSTEGYYAQHHHLAKFDTAEMMVCEEMPQPDETFITESAEGIDKELALGRNMRIAANMRTMYGEWKHTVVAYDADVCDSNPIGAINISADDEWNGPASNGYAACVWKRGQYVLPPYEEDEDASDEEKAQAKADVEATFLRAFEGDVMLSVFDGTTWGAPESVIHLEREDFLSDYQVLMRNDSVLVALTVLPKDKDQPELRYYSKPSGQALRYIATDNTIPVHFSLDHVAGNAMMAILNVVDSANNDIFVKKIDMEGRYSGYGTDLKIARFNPESVKIVADKYALKPFNFAVLWKCADTDIQRDGVFTSTDSTQTMLNCSRIYLRDNLATVPFITLGCTADSTYMSGYDAFLLDDDISVVYALTDEREGGNTYIMYDKIEFKNDFRYNIGYSQRAMINNDEMPVNLIVHNTGYTPITEVRGAINDQEFVFDDVFIDPFSSQTLAIDYKLPENFDGLLRAHDVSAIFEDTWHIHPSNSSRRAPARHRVAAVADVSEYAVGSANIRCELMGHSIQGTVNKVYLEVTDFDGLKDNETAHVGLYTSSTADVPICSTAEVLLKAKDFIQIGDDRKAYVELMVDGLQEEQKVEIRARVYNDNILEALGDDDDISKAIVGNLSWYDNQHIITLLPVELDDVTLLPVVKLDDMQHQVKVEQVQDGVWVSGLQADDYVRIFAASGMPVYQQRQASGRLFIPLRERGVYLLSTNQEILKFVF